MRRKLKIGVTINTLNELELTKNHLKSLIENTPLMDKLVIVDAPPPNKDFSCRRWLREFVKKKGKPEKILIELKKRWWLNYASNRGIERLLDCDYIITSNNDNFFRPNWLEPLIEIMEKDKSIGWMSPLTCNKDWKIISMGRNDLGSHGELLWFPLDDSDVLVPVLSTEGSVNVYRKKALEDIKNNYGYYDERILRMIEQDLGIRFWEKGWKVMMSPKSAMIHLVSYSIKKHRTTHLEPQRAKLLEKCRKGWSKYLSTDFFYSQHNKYETLKLKEKLRSIQKSLGCKIIHRSLYLPENLQMEFVEPKFAEGKRKSNVGIFLPVGLFSPVFKECIDALCQQTFKDWRCLIIADKPDKDFLKYLLSIRKKEKRIDLLIHNYLVKDIVRLKNIGLKYFDNVPFIMYLTDDLIMKPDCLEKMVKVLEKHPEFGVVSPTFPHGPYASKFVCVGNLWTKEAIDRVGIMDFEFSPCFQEEHDHMMRMVEKGFKPHRVIDAVMAHKKIGKGTLAKIHGKEFMSYHDSHKLKICKRYGKTYNEINRFILDFPTIEGEKDIKGKKKPKVAWLASNSVGTLYGGCMISCTNSIIGLDKLGINIKPYQFPYEEILNHFEFDINARRIKDLIDTNRNNFDLVKKDKSNVKCDILIEYRGPPEPMKDSDKHYNILWTTWETTHIDSERIKILNTADEIWVPSKFTKKIMVKAGIKVPVYTMPLGFNPEIFTPNLPPNRTPLIPKRGFTFLCMGNYEDRKGLDLFIKAFNREFKDEDVYALIHVTYGKKPPIKNPRIRIVKRGKFSLERFQMGELYASADCFVLPSRGEAFGLPALEALACALPVIYTNWGGQTDFLSPEIAYPVKYKLVRAKTPVLARCPEAKYAEVLISDLRKQMRYVYENYDEAKKKAEKGRKLILENWTWEHACQKMAERLQRIDYTKKRKIKISKRKKLKTEKKIKRKKHPKEYSCPENFIACIHCGTCNHVSASGCKKCGKNPSKLDKRRTQRMRVNIQRDKEMEKILFWSPDPHMLQSVYPIYHKMKELGFDVDIFWSPYNSRLYRDYRGFLVPKKFSSKEKYFRIISTWNMKSAPFALPRKIIKTIGIYTNHSLHGHEIFTWEGDNVCKNFNSIMFCGPWWKKEFFKKCKEKKNFAVVGWAKSDLLFDPNLDDIVEDAKKELNLPYKKTIFYPMSICSYKDIDAWKNRISTLKFLLNFCRREKINLIYNIHPSNWKKMKLLSENMNFGHNVTLLPWNIDSTKIFPIADILINENSSLLWEFLPSGKPSIQIKEQEHHSAYPPPFGVLSIRHDFEEMSDLILQCLDNPDINKKDREEALKKVHVADGHVVERAIKFIIGRNK